MFMLQTKFCVCGPVMLTYFFFCLALCPVLVASAALVVLALPLSMLVIGKLGRDNNSSVRSYRSPGDFLLYCLHELSFGGIN